MIIIIIMATNTYWTLNVSNIALSSVFTLLKLIFIKILQGRVVPMWQMRKIKRCYKLAQDHTSFISSPNNWIYCTSTKCMTLAVVRWTWTIPSSKFPGGSICENKSGFLMELWTKHCGRAEQGTNGARRSGGRLHRGGSARAGSRWMNWLQRGSAMCKGEKETWNGVG